jgi:putative endonuclease
MSGRLSRQLAGDTKQDVWPSGGSIEPFPRRPRGIETRGAGQESDRPENSVAQLRISSSIDDRVTRHNDGRAECAYTINRRPVTMAYSETLDSRTMAVRRERQMKRSTRTKKEALIARDPALLKRL